MIKATKIGRRYGKGAIAVDAIKDIDITIDDGEFVAIIGPSGAGKSTLLYQLSLLDTPTSGELHFNDRKISSLSEPEKTDLRLNELGYVFQEYALLPELTAMENVMLPILMQGSSRKHAYEQAERSLGRVGLSDRLGNLPNQLSGGQQQRVAIARATAHDPHILFADEPTANLDSMNSRLVLETFLDLHRQGQTIVMVTHEEEYAARAHRVITIKDGVIVSDARQSTYTAGMNPKDVLNFWFREIKPEMHWKKDEEFDSRISTRFLETHEALASNKLGAWQESPEGGLASVIVLDQFSRNIFRDTPKAFAFDEQALAIAKDAIAKGFDEKLPPEQRLFLYMPFMHSESKAVHEEAVTLFTALGLEKNLEYELKHKRIIDRFGRYPYRNEILGRESTREEKDFLASDQNSSF